MSDRRTVAVAAGIDIVAVLLFVVLGRRTHNEGGNAAVEAMKVAAPFLLALALGWLVAQAWHHPTEPTTGMVIWVVTVAAGMLLRHFVFDRGTALAFIIVASCFTLVFLVGWRFLWEWRAARR